MTGRRGKVTARTRIAFSTGAFEEAAIGAASIATMVFYNQVLGVSAYLCGIVFLVASVVDAVTDPLVGSLSDNFRSRWGRRHPFMVASLLPLGLGFYLLYAPPGGMSGTFYFWWFLGTMVLLRVGKTFFAVPHDALGAELTDDYHDRTSILVSRHTCSAASARPTGSVARRVPRRECWAHCQGAQHRHRPRGARPSGDRHARHCRVVVLANMSNIPCGPPAVLILVLSGDC